MERKLTLQLSSPELRGELLLVLGQHGDVLLGSLSEHTHSSRCKQHGDVLLESVSEHTQFTVQTWRCTSGICVRTHRHSSQCKQHRDVLLESVLEHIDRVHGVNHKEVLS